jgi:hypothetical protein
VPLTFSVLTSLESLESLRLTEHVHGHLGWLAAAALVHPAIVLRNVKRRAHLAVASSVTLVTLAAALGVLIYGPYRDRLRQNIFQTAPTYGWLFERKEHLAFAAVLLAWTGAIAYVGARYASGDLALTLRKVAFRAYVASAALALATATLGTLVAAYRTF